LQTGDSSRDFYDPNTDASITLPFSTAAYRLHTLVSGSFNLAGKDLKPSGESWSRFYGTGTDAMITIFCDFWQLSAKKLAFFSKNQFYDKFLHNLANFESKTTNFLLNFSAKIF
jgi:hypothetical protein